MTQDQGIARGEGAWKLKGDRYSPNLAKWCAKNSTLAANEVFRHADGTLYIGWIDDGHLIGSRLWQVLTSGAQAQRWCWPLLASDLTLIPAFWEDYARIGRCAIDTDHSHGFIGDENRWSETGDVRVCNWCGHQQQRERWTETVNRERWINATSIDIFSLARTATLTRGSENER